VNKVNRGRFVKFAVTQRFVLITTLRGLLVPFASAVQPVNSCPSSAGAVIWTDVPTG